MIGVVRLLKLRGLQQDLPEAPPSKEREQLPLRGPGRGVGSGEQEVGSGEQGAGSWILGSGFWDLEPGTQEPG